MILVFDIGNTRIKAAVFQDQNCNYTFTLEHQSSSDLLAEHLEMELNRIKIKIIDIADFALCGVVPESIELLRLAGEKLFGIQGFLFSLKEFSWLKHSYQDLSLLGVDRMAAALGAAAYYPGENIIIVDFGTALTLDAMTKDRVFCGGIIFPGLQTAAASLPLKAPRLPLVTSFQTELFPGTDPVSSIQNGLYYGFSGAVKEIISQLSKNCFPGQDYIVIGCGGDIELFKTEIEFTSIIPDLVLHGVYYTYLIERG